MPAKAVHSEHDQLAGEHFGEGGSDCFQKRTRANEMDIGIHGIIRGRQNTLAVNGLRRSETRCLYQSQPFLDAAGPCTVAIMVEDSLAPGTAKRRVVTTR